MVFVLIVSHVTVVPVYGVIFVTGGGEGVGDGTSWNTYISVVIAWKIITVDTRKMYQYLSAAKAALRYHQLITMLINPLNTRLHANR